MKHAIGVSSGTSALHLALLGAGIKPGDEVITVPNTFIATAEAISHVGAKPVFVDIDKETYTINVSKIKDKITEKTKAVIPVHLYGQMVEMDDLMELAQDNNLKIIEDSAQAHGAEYKCRKAGTIANSGCFSFYPGKNLGAYGDAGMVTTNDDEIAENVKILRDHGRSDKYEHKIIGFNHRIDALQAAILNVKLKYLNGWTDARRKNAKLYNELLSNVDVVTPVEKEYSKHVYHLYVIRTKKRDELQKYLKTHGIATGVHYPIPLHLQPAYSHLDYKEGDFTVTEEYSGEILSLPMFGELTEEEIGYVVEKIKEFEI
ncbi:MAG: hypothetical protein A7315_13480 [Candidatus Altiarchaeales archaeon WOR_SM1_79]|nr:MAG: hypothetical protein A7315_13480 [Candidatus Altiarchaeales archaeon WOR_SM1_79]